MTATTATRNNNISRLSSSLAVPLSHNTAPVHEFRCLFTHDIRRKNAKRWRDGILRFHTFNKRAMVYDYPDKNFIGDSHIRDRDEVEDGDDISLERGGAMVQVGEKISTENTDLTLLLVREKRQAEANQDLSSRNVQRLIQGRTSEQGLQLTPRSSNIQPNTPSRLIGRAHVSTESPFETRRMQNSYQSREEERPAKRRRNDENHIPLWEVLKTSKLPKSKLKPSRTIVTDQRPKISPHSIASSKRTPADGQARLKVKELIVLDSSLPTSSKDISPQNLEKEMLHQRVTSPSISLSHFSSVEPEPLMNKLSANQSLQVANNTGSTRVHRGPETPAEPMLDQVQDSVMLAAQRINGGDSRNLCISIGSATGSTTDVATSPITAPNRPPSGVEDVDNPRVQQPNRSSGKESPTVLVNHEYPGLPQPPIMRNTRLKRTADRGKPPLRSLCLATAAPRKKLLCQDTALARPPSKNSPNSDINDATTRTHGNQIKFTNSARFNERGKPKSDETLGNSNRPKTFDLAEELSSRPSVSRFRQPQQSMEMESIMASTRNEVNLRTSVNSRGLNKATTTTTHAALACPNDKPTEPQMNYASNNQKTTPNPKISDAEASAINLAAHPPQDVADPAVAAPPSPFRPPKRLIGAPEPRPKPLPATKLHPHARITPRAQPTRAKSPPAEPAPRPQEVSWGNRDMASPESVSEDGEASNADSDCAKDSFPVTGPWTVEAWDLFGWLPPDRQSLGVKMGAGAAT